MKRTGRRVPKFLAIVGLISTGILLVVPTTGSSPEASASGLTPGSCTSSGNPHNGFFHDSSRGSVQGARASLRARPSAPCSSSFTTLYVMLYVQPNSWSQVGYYKSQAGTNGHTVNWSQVNSNGSINDVFGSQIFNNDLYTYEVRYAAAYATVANFINGQYFSLVSNVSFSNYWYGKKWQLQFSEESLKLPSNVPGSSAHKAGVHNMSYWPMHYASPTWLSVDCGLINYVNNNPAHWAHYFTGDCDTQGLYTSNPY